MTCLSEHLSGLIIACVLVRMVFQRLCVVALFDLACTGVLLHDQNLVVAAARHGRRGSAGAVHALSLDAERCRGYVSCVDGREVPTEKCASGALTLREHSNRSRALLGPNGLLHVAHFFQFYVIHGHALRHGPPELYSCTALYGARGVVEVV